MIIIFSLLQEQIIIGRMLQMRKNFAAKNAASVTARRKI